MPSPPSEVDITAELVAALVADQHPTLAGPVSLVAHGWDCDLYRLGDDLAVRLPRRSPGARLVRNEQRWLPHLAARLPVPIPSPVARGEPGPRFAWPWSIVPWFPGTPGDLVDARARGRVADRLADFVVALHHPAPPDAPTNPYRGGPLSEHDSAVTSYLRALRSAGAHAAAIWADAASAPPPPTATWIHGDLHPANVVLGADGDLVAVLDYGELCVGDPAVDLAAAWLFFDGDGRRAFRRRVDARAPSTGGTGDGAIWRRARGWAIAFSVGLLTESDGSERMLGLGRAGLAAALSDD